MEGKAKDYIEEYTSLSEECCETSVRCLPMVHGLPGPYHELLDQIMAALRAPYFAEVSFHDLRAEHWAALGIFHFYEEKYKALIEKHKNGLIRGLERDGGAGGAFANSINNMCSHLEAGEATASDTANAIADRLQAYLDLKND